MNSRILGIATALPDHPFDQDRAVRVIERWFDGCRGEPELDRAKAVRIFRHAGVEQRYSAIPVEELLADRPLGEKNRDFIRVSKVLGERAVRAALDSCRVAASDVDLVISTSCTGFMIPSLDAYLANLLGFRRDVKRLPVTELGCAAGVAALRLADDYLRAHPDSTVLVLAVELATLTFQPQDFSADHIVSCAIFGDASAAMLLTNRPGPGLTIERTGTCFFPNTIDFMGFDLEASGFHIFLSEKIPRFIREELMPTVKDLLRDAPPINRWLVHPGGPKILDAIEDALSLPRGGLVESRDVLRRFGNLSSVTILFVLDACLKSGAMCDGERDGVVAVGPGFQMDYAILQWREK